MGTQLAIHGRRVAITGAARGIGRATAQALAQRGAHVVIGDIDGALAAQTAAELGERVIAFPVDVTSAESVQDFVRAAEDAIGPLDVFVNNAGIMATVRFVDEPIESIRRQFDINVFGVMHGMQAVLPSMIERGDGHVINIASTAGKFGTPGGASYAATKHAVVGLSDTVRSELSGTGVALSVVMPVIVRTELTAGIPETRGVKTLVPEDIAASIVEAIQTRRYEVWCPRSVKALYRVAKAMPLGFTDALATLTKADRTLLAGIGNPGRQAYIDRISTPEALNPGRDD